MKFIVTLSQIERTGFAFMTAESFDINRNVGTNVLSNV